MLAVLAGPALAESVRAPAKPRVQIPPEERLDGYARQIRALVAPRESCVVPLQPERES